jgi:hypothetical protein
MKERLRRFLDGFHPRPVAAWEWLVMRCLFAIVVWKSLPRAGDQIYSSQDAPNGIAHWIDLTFLSNPGVYPGLQFAIGIALVIYVSGFLLPIVLPFLLVGHVLVRTLFNSQGWIHHGVQMVSLVLLAQTVIVLSFAGYRLIKGRRAELRPGLKPASYLRFYSQMAVVSLYVVSVFSKVDRSDWQWFAKSHYVGLHVVKAERDRYHAALEAPEPGDVPSARLMLAHPNLTRLLLGAGVALEFLAFLALRGRLWALAVGLGLIGFHRCIAALMSIHFHFNEMLLVIFLINAPYWIVRGYNHLFGKGNTSPAPNPVA